MSASLERPALLAGEGLPTFEAITPNQVTSHIPKLLGQLETDLDQLEATLALALDQGRPLGWSEVMDPLHRLGERLRWSWGVVSHLNGVCNTPELREAHASQQPAVVAFGNRAGQSRTVYAALRALERQGGLDATQQRILAAELRDMDLRGVGLEGEAQQAFNGTNQELAELGTRFGNNVLDATNGWTLLLEGEDEVAGLPESVRQLLAQAAAEAGHTQADGSAPTAVAGPWLLGLDMPRFGPFMQYGRNRALRERAYKAHVSRASGEEGGNWPLIERILSLRLAQARRLGYANWAEVSLASKMAGSEHDVEALLEDLRVAALPAARRSWRNSANVRPARGHRKPPT